MLPLTERSVDYLEFDMKFFDTLGKKLAGLSVLIAIIGGFVTIAANIDSVRWWVWKSEHNRLFVIASNLSLTMNQRELRNAKIRHWQLEGKKQTYITRGQRVPDHVLGESSENQILIDNLEELIKQDRQNIKDHE